MQLIVYESAVSAFMAYDASYMARVQEDWTRWRDSDMVCWLRSRNVEIKMLRHQDTENNAFIHAAKVAIDGADLTEFMLRFGDQL
jgi:hypothetical protein